MLQNGKGQSEKISWRRNCYERHDSICAGLGQKRSLYLERQRTFIETERGESLNKRWQETNGSQKKKCSTGTVFVVSLRLAFHIEKDIFPYYSMEVSELEPFGTETKCIWWKCKTFSKHWCETRRSYFLHQVARSRTAIYINSTHLLSLLVSRDSRRSWNGAGRC